MIRIIVEIGRKRCGSLFLHDDNTVEFHATDHAAFLDALGIAYAALQGREHRMPRVKPGATLAPRTGEK